MNGSRCPRFVAWTPRGSIGSLQTAQARPSAFADTVRSDAHQPADVLARHERARQGEGGTRFGSVQDLQTIMLGLAEAHGPRRGSSRLR